MQSHEIDYKIIGDDMQAVEVELDPKETVIAEAGAMNWVDDRIDFETKMGDGSKPNQGLMGKLFDAGKRMISGESLFLTHFTNKGQDKRKIAFAASYPGSIIPLDLSNLPEQKFICQKDAFLCAALGTRVDILINKRIGSGFFGGEGFILQELTGDGKVFVHGGGAVVKKELNDEVIKVDTGCLIGFTDGIDYNIERAGNLKSMLFGGEGLFLTTLRGTGTVYLQSLPFSRLANRILEGATEIGGEAKGEH